MHYEFHEVANIFPLIEGAEFESLKADIEQHGQREPIWLHDGKIVDGRNRYRACKAIPVEPKCQEWDGKGSLVAFVVSLNLKRRHLTKSQIGAVGVRAKQALEVEIAEAEARRKAGQPRCNGKFHTETTLEIVPKSANATPRNAREEVAASLGVSGKYISEAERIEEKAPELLRRVEAGTTTIPQAKAELKRQEKREALQRRADEIEREDAARTVASCELAIDKWSIVTAEAAHELSAMQPSLARLIFADPPYNIGIDYGEGERADRLSDEEYMGWVENWFVQCRRILTDDGSLWVLIGDEYAAEFGVTLKRIGFTLRAWVKWYETFGVNCANNFNRCSRHLFYCVKDAKRFVFNPDAVNRPSDRQTKYGDARADPGGKIWDDVWVIPRLVGTAKERIPDFPTQLPLELLRPIIGCASDPGDLVVDPFCGSGTTGAAALEMGRRFIGIEKSPRFAELSTLRLKGVRRGNAAGD